MLPLREFLGPAARLWLTQPGQALLSMLGVSVGVAGLFLVLAVGRGAENEIQNALGELGAGTVILRPVEADEEDTQELLTPDFLSQLEAVLPSSLELSAPARRVWLAAQSSAGQALSVDVRGVTPAHAALSGQRVAWGRYIADLDIRNGSRVRVLGAGLARALYPRGDALNQQLRMGDSWYRIVGVLPDEGLLLGRPGSSQARKAESVYVPLSSPLFLRDQSYSIVTLRFADKSALFAAMPLIERALSAANLQEAVVLELPITALRSQYAVQRTFAAMLLAASVIVLVIAGVGVMNTMLLNVAARRSEIGLRRAIGATRSHILSQFILEAVMLTVTGGLAGVFVGVVGSYVVSTVTSWTLSLGALTVGSGVLSAMVLGALFGGYPAWRAAGLNPVQTLRGPV